MEYAILSLVGLIGGVGLFKAWRVGMREQPMPAPTPTITARVVDPGPGPMSEAELMRQLQLRIAERGQLLAIEKETTRLIEAQAAQAVMPWASKPPDPPKG